MNLIFLAALIILVGIWLEERSYSRVHKEVYMRWLQGDKTCGAKRTWWGWRVIEYAEESDSQL